MIRKRRVPVRDRETLRTRKRGSGLNRSRATAPGWNVRIMSIDATTIPQAKASGFGQVPAWLWIGAGLYVLLLVNNSGLLNDSDTYWQIAVGQSILDHGALPRVDVYSFTKPGEAWLSSSWLAQIIYAVSYNLAGWTGPVVVAAAAIAATFGLLAHIL
jgi:hypothetical protein